MKFVVSARIRQQKWLWGDLIPTEYFISTSETVGCHNRQSYPETKRVSTVWLM